MAILPFILSRRRIGPLKVAYVSPLGEDPSVTEIRTPMIEAGYEYLAVEAAQTFLEKVPDWDWVQWAHLGPEVRDALGGATLALHWRPPLIDVVLDLAPTWEEFRTGLKRNIRESLRHGYNSLKRDGLALEFDVLEEPADVRRGLDRYLELHRMRADCTRGPVHPDRFTTNASRGFLYDICDRLAARNEVRLFALNIRGKYIAMRLGFVIADSLYLYYSGFDPAWWGYGVMTTTDAESIKYAIEHGFKTVNLSPTNIISKSRWGPRECAYSSAYQPRSNLFSRLATGAYAQESLLGRILRRLARSRSWG